MKRDMPAAHGSEFRFVCSSAYELPHPQCDHPPMRARRGLVGPVGFDPIRVYFLFSPSSMTPALGKHRCIIVRTLCEQGACCNIGHVMSRLLISMLCSSVRPFMNRFKKSCIEPLLDCPLRPCEPIHIVWVKLSAQVWAWRNHLKHLPQLHICPF
jgi:hypothetical protein